jgi:hypothetical protein
MLAIAFVAFAVVPSWLLDRTATRVTTTGRDLILIGWWMAAFIGCCWAFVRLQGRGG